MFHRKSTWQGARLYRDVRGHVLRLPSGIICVPLTYQGNGYWSAIPVGGPNAVYGAGAWDISIHTEQIDEAERIDVK
ncbi:hypothetical protein NPS70_16445 [Streptomyces sp. C10-9-1]|uniref:hypothetical protein n=1 Tax=Streptomyces sp. C10-9-1 TaxID=1859285 RepID=UPI00211249E9|nr:hypothetical protein [Streptomyces sp. C10-9-1]MCQ6554776.1 hypothetical protein [Streptomyces sp. C10-9-1]